MKTRPFVRLLPLLLVAVFSVSLTNCSLKNLIPSSGPGNTNVVVMLTTTANDRLAEFNLAITSILLFDKSGTSTAVFVSPNPLGTPVEWMHLNGSVEPMAAVVMPRGTYTSAKIMVAGCQITNITFPQSTMSLTTAVYAEGLCGQGTGETTVTLPDPITITGSVTVLALNLQVSQSYTLNQAVNPATYTISPAFTLTAISRAGQPTNDSNGKATGLDGQVTAISGKTFTVQTTDGAALIVTSGASTTYQGIAGFSALATGVLVNVDAAVQSDGSLLATRVEVDDPTTPAGIVGPFLIPTNQPDSFVTLDLQQNGCSNVANPVFCGIDYAWVNGTPFAVSGQFSNVASLPFPAAFTGSSIVQGQHFSVLTTGVFSGQNQTVTNITLEPQTLNGTVTAISNQNGFAVYTVALAPYDLFPILQNYGTTGRLSSPATFVAYVDTTTQMLNTGMISTGSLLRFRGVIFNDSGTLRMDTGQIYDGVTE